MNEKDEELSITKFKKKLELWNPKLNYLNYLSLGFSGFGELVRWVLQQIEEETNTLKDTGLFIDYLVIDKLYTELYHRT